MLHFVVSTDSIQYFSLSQSFLLFISFIWIFSIQFISMMFSLCHLLLDPYPHYLFNFKISPSPHSSFLSFPLLTLIRFLSLHCKTVSTITVISFRNPQNGKHYHLATEDNVLMYVLPSKSWKRKLCALISYDDDG